MILKGN